MKTKHAVTDVTFMIYFNAVALKKTCVETDNYSSPSFRRSFSSRRIYNATYGWMRTSKMLKNNYFLVIWNGLFSFAGNI